MRTARFVLALCCLLPRCAKAQPTPIGVQTVQWLLDRQWIREATGRNDGPAVAALVRAGGGEYTATYHPEWCGFTQAADQLAHGLPIPKNGMQGAAAAWFPPNRLVSLDAVEIGHQAGFDYSHGIHHIARVAVLGRPVRPGRPPRNIWTIAGNEGRGTTAGVHLTNYPATNIAAFSNWLY